MPALYDEYVGPYENTLCLDKTLHFCTEPNPSIFRQTQFPNFKLFPYFPFFLNLSKQATDFY